MKSFSWDEADARAITKCMRSALLHSLCVFCYDTQFIPWAPCWVDNPMSLHEMPSFFPHGWGHALNRMKMRSSTLVPDCQVGGWRFPICPWKNMATYIWKSLFRGNVWAVLFRKKIPFLAACLPFVSHLSPRAFGGWRRQVIQPAEGLRSFSSDAPKACRLHREAVKHVTFPCQGLIESGSHISYTE